MPCRTLIVSLVGFQQLLDNLKLAIFEKKFTPFISLILNIKLRNFEFFSKQATAKQLALFKSVYIVETAHQFWLDLKNSLTFSKKLYKKKVNSLISYGNNERTNFSPTQARSENLFDLEFTCHVEL